MKTIDEIKKEFKAATGKNLPIYTYEGELGVLYENYTGYCYMPEFVPMDEFLTKESINFDNVRWVTVGADCCEEGEEITDEPIRNEENDQKLMVDGVWSPVTTNKSDEYVRELLTETTQYHDWTSERTHMYECLEQDIEKANEELCFYNGYKDDELETDEREKRDNLIAGLQHVIRDRKKDWEDTCAEYEDPEGWADYTDVTTDFKDLFDNVAKDLYERDRISLLTWDAAAAAIEADTDE